MFKKIIILVALITLSVVVMAEIELLTISDTSRIEIVQMRNLRAAKNAESIRSNIVDLDQHARTFTYYQNDQSIKSFWQDYRKGVSNVDQLMYPIHGGDCKSCHQAFALLRSERRMLSELVRYNNSGANETLSNAYLRDQFASHISKIKKATTLINNQEKQELVLAIEGQKKILDKTDYLRLDKARKLFDDSSSSLVLLKSTENKIAASNIEQAKQLLKKQDSVFPLPVKDPSLNSDCYSCHLAISNLHDQGKLVADSAYTVFSTKNGSPQNTLAIEKYDTAIINYRESATKITNLSQIVLKKSMDNAASVRKRFQLVTTATTAITMLLTLLGSALIISWTRRRLSTFSTAIKAITAGDYSHTMNIRAKDEFTDISHAFNLMVNKVNQTQASLKSLHLNTVKALIEAIEAKDPYTRGHSENVARYAMLLGHELSLSTETLDRLHAAALLHDVGKIGIREDVLNKPAKLDRSEYEHIKTHPAISAQIVGSIPNLATIANIIKHHHEHYDGKGYVDGLSGNEIPLESRILSIADTFDAMTSDRPYRESCSKQKAVTELRKCSGKQFDPDLVERFIIAVKSVRIKKSRKQSTKEQDTKSLSA